MRSAGCAACALSMAFVAAMVASQAPTSVHHAVVWFAPFLSGGGYSSEAISYALELHRRLPHSFGIVQFAEQASPDFARGLPVGAQRTLQTLMHRASHTFRRGAIAICHATPDLFVPAAFPGWDAIAPCPPPKAAYSIARTMYETDSLPPGWAERCNALDAVWVPSEFHRRTFEGAGVDGSKIAVVPEAVDTSLFDPAKHTPLPLPLPQLPSPQPREPYVFLSVFKWEKRKGWDVLLEAYLREFSRTDPVLLVVKTRPFYSESNFDAMIESFGARLGVNVGESARIHVLDEELPMHALPRLYRAADALVAPSRGEGWGRPHAEAMAMGLPVLATNWSGNTAFMTSQNSFPIAINGTAPVPGGHGNWALPSVAHLRRTMRFVFENRAAAVAVGARARRDMVEKYSPEPVAAIVLEQLKAIEGKLATKEHGEL